MNGPTGRASGDDGGGDDARGVEAGGPHGDASTQRRVWDRAARLYDAPMAALELVWFTGGRRWIGERARGRVLDIAVGTGRNLPHYPPHTMVTGIDISPGMLAQARRRADRRGRRVELDAGDAARLPYDDGSFDTAVCTLSLCEVPRVAAALHEMHRVLVPGGRLLLLDHIGSTWPLLLAAQRAIERPLIALGGEHLTRRPLREVADAGFRVEEHLRTRAGTVEKVHAVSLA